MSTPPPRKICCFLFVQEVGGERWLCGFASGGCGACSGRLRRSGSKWSVRHTKYQATMLSCSASSGKPHFNSPDCIVAWYFCGMSWYLHDWDIRYRRCFLGCGGICMAGIFAVADAFWGCCGICMTGIFAVADAFFLPVMYNCIFNLPISWLVDTHFYQIASAICLFYILKMLPLKK